MCTNSQFIGTQDQCLNSDIGALVDLRLRNVETLSTDGFDFNGRYGRETPIGTFGVNLTATYVLHYREAEIPGGGLVEYRNTPHNPTALHLRGLFNWEHRGFSVSPAINFQSSYTDIDRKSCALTRRLHCLLSMSLTMCIDVRIGAAASRERRNNR